MRRRLLGEIADRRLVRGGVRLPLRRGPLAGQRLQRRLVGLVGAQPELPPQGRVVVLDRHGLDAGAALEVAVVEARIADAQVGAQDAAAVGVRGGQRPQGRVHRRLLEIVDRVAEVVRARLVAEMEVGHRARQLVLQRALDHGVVRANARLDRHRRRLFSRVVRARHRAERQQDRRQRPEAANHCRAPFVLAGGPGGRAAGAAGPRIAGGDGCSDGAGSTGGLSLPLSRRSVSIC